jgi:hypothetical protein
MLLGILWANGYCKTFACNLDQFGTSFYYRDVTYLENTLPVNCKQTINSPYMEIKMTSLVSSEGVIVNEKSRVKLIV